MPKRLKKSDKETVFFSYRLGVKNGISFYDQINVGEAQFVSFDRYVNNENYGKELTYNALLLFEVDNYTQFIDEFTKFWVREKPLSADTPTNYRVNSVSKPENGIISVYLSSLTTNNYTLWYLYKGQILETQMQFDIDTLRGVAPKNMYLPWNETTKIWYEEPENANTTTALLRVAKNEVTELGNNFTFKRV